MNTFLRNKNLIFIIASIFFISISGCEKNPSEPEKETPPPLPPAGSMSLDLSFFSATPEGSLSKTAQSKNNFTAAAIRVLFIHAGVALASVVPSAIFVSALAMDKDPELESDGKFHWIYNTHHGPNTFGVDLAGWIDMAESEIVWEVFVTSNTHMPALDHFFWYTGRAEIGNKEGYWIFHDDKSTDSTIEVLRVEWSVQDSTHKQLIFTNINQSSEDYGDSLKYAVDGVDNTLVFFDASENQTNTIYWNSENHTGYIEWFDYNNGEKSYWDENQDDIAGPPA